MSSPPTADLAQVPLSRIIKSSTLMLFAFVVGGDLAGVFLCLGLDVSRGRSASSLAFWALWFVLGVFAGFGAYLQGGAAIAGDDDLSWTERPGARAVSLKMLAVFAVELTLLTAVSGALFWTDATDGIYVPDNAVATVLFFGALLAAAGFGHHLFHVPAKTTR